MLGFTTRPVYPIYIYIYTPVPHTHHTHTHTHTHTYIYIYIPPYQQDRWLDGPQRVDERKIS